MISPTWPQLSPAEEERATEIHRRSTIFICHDHELMESRLELMATGGVTAKQVFVSLDASIFGMGGAFSTSMATALRGEHADFVKWALVAFEYMHQIVERSDGRYVLGLSAEDIVSAKENGQQVLVLGSEGTRLLADRLEILHVFHRLGLRHLQLSWDLPNSVGTNQNESNGKGLSPYGRDLIGELNSLGMMVDVSHLSYQSQLEAVDVSKSPILNSHSGALALNPTKVQLLPDEVIRAIAARDGVIGIHFISSIVKPGSRTATLRELMDQFAYVIELVGSRHVACGPDYFPIAQHVWQNQGQSSPYTYADGVEDLSRMINVTRGLVGLGLPDEDIENILGGNLLRLFRHSARAMSDLDRHPIEPAAMGELTGGTTPL